MRGSASRRVFFSLSLLALLFEACDSWTWRPKKTDETKEGERPTEDEGIECKIQFKRKTPVNNKRQSDYDYIDGNDSYMSFKDDAPRADGEYDGANNGYKSRMWRGDLINPEDAPFAVSIMDPLNLKYVHCSGSFVTPRVVITAAHCFRVPVHPELYFIRYNTQKPVQVGGRDMAIKQIIRHPRFSCNPLGDPYPHFDIAIVILHCDAEIIGTWQVLNLPFRHHAEKFIDNPDADSILTLVATGKSFSWDESYVLKKVRVFLFTKRCEETWVKFDTNYNLCNWEQDPLWGCPGTFVNSFGQHSTFFLFPPFR